MKDNKIIAEFMGYKYDKCCFSTDNSTPIETQGDYLTPNQDWVCETELKFHTSWDWLMPVVEKIYSLDAHIDFFRVINLEATYKRVVEFIKDRG